MQASRTLSFWLRSSTLIVSLLLHEKGLASDGVKSQHRSRNNAEGKMPHLWPQGHRRGRSEQPLAELVDQRHDRRAIALEGNRGEQLAHYPVAGL